MPRPLDATLLTLPSFDTLARELNALDRGAVARLRRERDAVPASPELREQVRRKVSTLVDAVKARAATRRTPEQRKAIERHSAAMAAAKQRLTQVLQQRAGRPPAKLIQAMLQRCRGDAAKLPSRRRTSLLIRSDEPDAARFADVLAAALGVTTPRTLATFGIHVRRVSSTRGSVGATYAVHLPVRRGSVRTEIHNFAWAVRKSGRFTSVRPDGLRKAMFGVRVGHAQRAERVFAWPLVLTRTLEAHQLEPAEGGRARGAGIIIAHPDTGWAPHPQYDVDRIDREGSFNAGTGETGGNAARHGIALADAGLPNGTHGTATGSIMVGGSSSRIGISDIAEADLVFPAADDGARDYGSDDRVLEQRGSLTGVAPRAKVRPIKFIDDVDADIDRTGLNGIGVVRIADEDLVVAIDRARTGGAHVVSLSIGGLMHDAVREAIDAAVEANLIIVAAAGQTYAMAGFNDLSQAVAGLGVPVGDTVTLPAAYANVIAVAGCCPDGRPWDESLRGPNVDITAPADALWVADFEKAKADERGDRLPVLESASGTSFAAAFMAGVAALWLAHWGRDRLLAQYPDVPLAWVFRHQLQRTANAAHAADWDTVNYGPGVVDVLALLKEPLPDADDVQAPPATTANVLTVASDALASGPAGALGDFWALVYDLGATVGGAAEEFGNAAWAAARGTAEALVAMGAQALQDLQAGGVGLGAAIDRERRAAVEGVTTFLEAAVEAAEDVTQAAADAGESAVEAVEEFAEQAVDAVGEAAEDVIAFLFG